MSQTTAMVGCTLVLVTLSAMALPRNYRVPKQDFDGAVAYLESVEARGARIVAAGPACLPLQIYYTKPWPCLESAADWEARPAGSGDLLLVHTLTDYIEDPALREHVRRDCQPTRRFDATLGAGEIIVCDAGR
jgi:hypothetical protein